MKRFDQKCLFDQLAAAGGLTPDLTTDLARMIAGFHRTAPVVHEGGGAANIASVLDINEAGLAAATHVFARWKIARFNAAFRDALLPAFEAARPPRSGGQGAPLSRRSAPAQHLPAGR